MVSTVSVSQSAAAVWTLVLAVSHWTLHETIRPVCTLPRRHSGTLRDMIWCETLKVEPTTVIIFKNTVSFLLCVNQRSTDSERLLILRGGRRQEDGFIKTCCGLDRTPCRSCVIIFVLMHLYDAPFSEDVTQQNNRLSVGAATALEPVLETISDVRVEKKKKRNDVLRMSVFSSPLQRCIQKVPSQKSNNNSIKPDVQCGIKIPTHWSLLH